MPYSKYSCEEPLYRVLPNVSANLVRLFSSGLKLFDNIYGLKDGMDRMEMI